MRLTKILAAIMFMSVTISGCSDPPDREDPSQEREQFMAKTMDCQLSEILDSDDFIALRSNFSFSNPDCSGLIVQHTDSAIIRFINIDINGIANSCYLMAMSDNGDTSILKVYLIDATSWESSGLISMYAKNTSNRFTLRKQTLANGSWRMVPHETVYEDDPNSPEYDALSNCVANCFWIGTNDCYNDPGCNLNCYLAGDFCEFAIFVSCAIWCWFMGGGF